MNRISDCMKVHVDPGEVQLQDLGLCPVERDAGVISAALIVGNK